MVTQYGMSDKLGLMALSTVSNPYLDGSTMMNCADSTSSAADEEIHKLLMDCYADAKKLLVEHRSLLDEIAMYLLSKETITGDEFMAYVNADSKRLTDGSEAEEPPSRPRPRPNPNKTTRAPAGKRGHSSFAPNSRLSPAVERCIFRENDAEESGKLPCRCGTEKIARSRLTRRGKASIIGKLLRQMIRKRGTVVMARSRSARAGGIQMTEGPLYKNILLFVSR